LNLGKKRGLIVELRLFTPDLIAFLGHGLLRFRRGERSALKDLGIAFSRPEFQRNYWQQLITFSTKQEDA